MQYKKHGNAHNARQSPQFILVAMEFKRKAKEDQEFKSKRTKLANLRILQQVPYLEESDADLYFIRADDSLRLDTSSSSIAQEDQQSEDEDMEISS